MEDAEFTTWAGKEFPFNANTQSHAIHSSDGHSALRSPACSSSVTQLRARQLHAAGGTQPPFPATTPSAVRGGLTQQHLTGRRGHCGASENRQQPCHSAPRPLPEAGHRWAGTAPAAAPPRDEAAAPQGHARGGGSAARCPLLTPCGAAPGLQRVASSRVVPWVVPLETLPKAESPRSRSVGG